MYCGPVTHMPPLCTPPTKDGISLRTLPTYMPGGSGAGGATGAAAGALRRCGGRCRAPRPSPQGRAWRAPAAAPRALSAGRRSWTRSSPSARPRCAPPRRWPRRRRRPPPRRPPGWRAGCARAASGRSSVKRAMNAASAPSTLELSMRGGAASLPSRCSAATNSRSSVSRKRAWKSPGPSRRNGYMWIVTSPSGAVKTATSSTRLEKPAGASKFSGGRVYGRQRLRETPGRRKGRAERNAMRSSSELLILNVR